MYNGYDIIIKTKIFFQQGDDCGATQGLGKRNARVTFRHVAKPARPHSLPLARGL